MDYQGNDERVMELTLEAAARVLREHGFASFGRRVQLAEEEITRLRASQFRWIAVGERLPVPGEMGPGASLLVKSVHGDVAVWVGFLSCDKHHITHWAPIPPLPGKSPEDRDEGLWREFLGDRKLASWAEQGTVQTAFLAGLKAAREEQERFAQSHNEG
jgi:hypothetical protein